MKLSVSTKLTCALVAVVAYCSVAGWLKYSYKELPRPPGEAVFLGGRFHRYSSNGFYYSTRLPAFREVADSETEQRSPITLYENDRLLGPAHSMHYDIELKGGGRFSHWMDGNMIFST